MRRSVLSTETSPFTVAFEGTLIPPLGGLLAQDVKTSSGVTSRRRVCHTRGSFFFPPRAASRIGRGPHVTAWLALKKLKWIIRVVPPPNFLGMSKNMRQEFFFFDRKQKNSGELLPLKKGKKKSESPRFLSRWVPRHRGSHDTGDQSGKKLVVLEPYMYWNLINIAKAKDPIRR